MKIVELHIREFGALKDWRMTPAEGLTVIGGDNESGKSTVMLFIKFMLYGLPKRGQAERERSVSWDTHCAAGSMTVRVGEEEYRIERSYTDGGRGSDKVTVFRRRDGEKVFVGEEPGVALLGVPKEIFESSCSIGQMQCAGLGGKKEAAAIQNLLSSADESVDIARVEKKLEDIRVVYRHKKGEGGRIGELNRQINETQRRLEQATENHARIEEVSRRLGENAAQLTQIEKKRDETEQLLGECNRIEIVQRFDQLHKNEEALRQLAEKRTAMRQSRWGDAPLPERTEPIRLTVLADELERREAEALEAASGYTRVSESAEWDEKAADIGAKAEAAGGEAALRSQMKNATALLTTGVIGTVLGCAATLIGGAVLATGALPIASALCLVGVLCAVGGLALCLRGRSKTKRLAQDLDTTPKAFSETLTNAVAQLRQKREAMERLAAAERARDAAQSSRERSAEELARLMSRLAPDRESTVQAAREEASRIETLLKDDARLEQEENSLRGIVANDRELLSVYRDEELRTALGDVPREISREMMDRAKREKAFLDEKARSLREAEKQLQTELINRRATAENPMTVADRLRTLQSEKKDCESYCGALETALEALRQAGETMRGNVTPAISRDAGRMMDYISDGRYSELRAGNTLSVSLVEEKGMTAPSELLSGGTRDAAYITLRIALMMQIFGEELPPLMMDETLCQVDDRRLKRILSLLGKLTEERLQCLLFTCHGREAEACRELGIPFYEVRIE